MAIQLNSPRFSCSIEALDSVLPASLIDSSLNQHKVNTTRFRKLPAILTVWLVILLALFRFESISNVLLRLVDSLGVILPWTRSESPVPAPCSSAIAQARKHIGWEVLKTIFEKLAQSLHLRFDKVSRWKGHFLCAFDGVGLRMPDTPDNHGEFGRPGSSRGKAAYPQMRCVALVAVFTHIMLSVTTGAFHVGELTLAYSLVSAVPMGSLVLMDRGFFAYGFLQSLINQGCFILVRAKTGKSALCFKKQKKLGSGDWLGVLKRPKKLKTGPEEIPVRIITYQIPGFRWVTLITTLLDPEQYPAQEIIELYHSRWEIELCFDEIKTHLAAEPVPFRSMSAILVRQEAYGLFIAFNIIRALMATAAEEAGCEPRGLSFTGSLAAIRLAIQTMARLEASQLPREYKKLISRIGNHRLPERRERTNPREVKKLTSKFPCKKTRNDQRKQTKRTAA